jgi:hypothetical protein
LEKFPGIPGKIPGDSRGFPGKWGIVKNVKICKNSRGIPWEKY